MGPATENDGNGPGKPMEPIEEKDLDISGKNNAIERLRIQQLDDGRYSLIVKLNWRAAELVLITQRKKVRGWVNLGLLLDHIKHRYGITSDITVTLTGEKK